MALAAPLPRIARQSRPERTSEGADRPAIRSLECYNLQVRLLSVCLKGDRKVLEAKQNPPLEELG